MMGASKPMCKNHDALALSLIGRFTQHAIQRALSVLYHILIAIGHQW